MSKRSSLLGAAALLIVVWPAVSLFADSSKMDRCQCFCDQEGYAPYITINLIVDYSGKTAVAAPECACVKPGGTVTWQSAPTRKLAAMFDGLDPVDHSPNQVINDQGKIKCGAKLGPYHYTAVIHTPKAEDITVDPHVVVGNHPPAIEDSQLCPPGKK
jgi:hypothetical protein